MNPEMNGAPARIRLTFSGDHIAQYSNVIVESWDKRRHGRVRRAWLNEFTESERNTLARWYRRFYGFCMRTGHPQEIRMDGATHDLIVRCANFFATI